MHYHYYTADVFTNQPFSGNPLAVFPEAAGLDTATMHNIAREFNLSETVFVFPPQKNANVCALRIFTPAGEVPFAGHPTLGTAFVLADMGKIPLHKKRTSVIFEEKIGEVQIDIDIGDNHNPTFIQLTVPNAPEFRDEVPNCQALAEILSLDVNDIRNDLYMPQAVSCGLPFICIPLKNLRAVQRAQINNPAWQTHLQEAWAQSLYLFSFETLHEENQIHARMFAPQFGISEDPATGSAAAALAAYLAQHESLYEATLRWQIEQGEEIQRPSCLYVEADRANNVVTAVRVGGKTVLMSEGWLDLLYDAN